MAKNTQQPKRGATMLPVKKPKKQWQFAMPQLSVPMVFWAWLLGVLVVLSAAYGGQLFFNSWPVKDISVTGRLQVWQASQLAEQVSWAKEQSFFSLDVDQVRQQLLQMPLLSKVSVQKRWPGIVNISVIEDVPVALWNDNQVLSTSGLITDIPPGLDTSNLIQMQGPKLQATQAAVYFRRIQQIVGASGVRVDRLSMSTVESVQVELSNGWTVEFGRQYFEERVLRLKKLLEHFPAEKISKIDLRYGKGAAIRWRPQQEIG